MSQRSQPLTEGGIYARRHETHDREGGRKAFTRKKTVKLTVKDIVEECHITRQAFYYHFADIPDLLDWIITQKEDELIGNYQDHEPMKNQDQLRYWSLITLNANSYLKKIEKSAYRDEIEKILFSHLMKLFTHIAQESESFRRLDSFDQELFVRYHCYALTGILRGWDERSSLEELDRTLYDSYIFITGEFLLLEQSRHTDGNDTDHRF